MLNAKDVSRGLSLVATITLVGCTGTESLDTVPVEGMVTMNDSPVEGATVVFTPAGGEGHAAAGVTDASGRFQLTTEASGDGAVPGSYKVKITKYPKQGDAIGGETDMDAAYRAAEESGEYVVGLNPSVTKIRDRRISFQRNMRIPTHPDLTPR